MSERAYSLELGEHLSAKQASELSIKNKLTDKRSFQCSDPNCRINLTCTNWKRTGKRYYFTPSTKDELHIVGCTEVSVIEAKEQSKREAELAKETIQKNGLIKMTKSINKGKSNISATQEDVSTSNNGTLSNSKAYSKSRYESRQLYSIASFVELFEDVNVDNESQFISIGNSKLSLNELFLDTSLDEFPQNTTRIFYGKAIIETAPFGVDMLQIEFQDSQLPKIYSNIKILSQRPTTSKILSYLDKGKSTMVYFRGQLIKNETKFEPFNDKVYKDIHLN